MENSSVKQKLEVFFSTYASQIYNKKEIIIRPDDVPGVVFCIQEGVVRMYAISANGEELILNTFKPGAFFPMGWVLNDIAPRHFYESMEKVVVKQVPKAIFLKFLQKNPDILMDLTKRIYYGLEGYFTRMEYLMSGNASSRLITELVILGKRFGTVENKVTTVALKLTERDLAAQIGITRETVSRELNKLKQKGLVTFDKQIVKISDISMLEAELAS